MGSRSVNLCEQYTLTHLSIGISHVPITNTETIILVSTIFTKLQLAVLHCLPEFWVSVRVRNGLLSYINSCETTRNHAQVITWICEFPWKLMHNLALKSKITGLGTNKRDIQPSFYWDEIEIFEFAYILPSILITSKDIHLVKPLYLQSGEFMFLAQEA